jgi:MarR family transcriptional regulator, organic hydroperoxide resistance regulator
MRAAVRAPGVAGVSRTPGIASLPGNGSNAGCVPNGAAESGAGTAAASADADSERGAFISGYLAYLLARASHLISGEFHRQLEAQRVPVMTWRVLASLADGPMTAKQLADFVLQKQPTLSKLLDRMAAQGLVRREPNPQDRRSVLVRLTPKGRRLATPLCEAAKRHEALVLEPFGEANARTLIRVLQRLIDQHAARARND